MGILNISGLAKLVGMNVHTIRAWERRYNALQPERSPAGQRTYSIEDVEKLKKLKHLNEMGMSIGRIANLSLHELAILEQDKSLVTHVEPKKEPSQAAVSAEEIENLITDTIDSLYQYDVDAISYNLNKYRIQMSAKDFVLQVISPLFHLVSRMVLELKLNIAQEHILFAIVRDQISFLITPIANENSPRIALASPEGDLHEFGIILSHVMCISNNIKSYYMGCNLPLQSLVEVTNALSFDYVILSCTSQNLGYEKLTFKQYIDEYLKAAQTNAKVLISGKAAALIDVSEYDGRIEYVSDLYALDKVLNEMGHG
jgi:MerR family transcriptional regulator, light-induced transcriptional regulator